jgi:hypothetical protein
MNNRILGCIGMVGAPFLLIDTVSNGFYLYNHSSLSGLYNLIYITAWICSIVGLWRAGAFGNSKTGRWMYFIQLFFLALANAWNAYELIQPGAGTPLYYVLDTCWPLSNICMLATGITLLRAGRLPGWKRFVPLLVGLWLPIGFLLWAIFSRTPAVLLAVNIYSAVMWFLLGLTVFLSPDKSTNETGVYAVSFGS